MGVPRQPGILVKKTFNTTIVGRFTLPEPA